jgi:ADP-heptose:LPS heptosyltransferase
VLQHWKTWLFGDRRRLVRGNSRGPERPRILIVRAGAIGDTLMATPLVRAVRRTFPDAHLAFLCSSAARDVLAHNPHLDELFALAYRHIPSGVSPEKALLVHWLRKLELDWAVVLESRPSLVDLASRFRAARLAAYGATSGGPAERATFDPNTHSIENHLRAGETFLGARRAGLEMELHYPMALRSSIESRLSAAGIRPGDLAVGLHAGWGNRPHALDETRLKSWPPQRFAAVARWLAQSLGARVVLTGSAPDRALNRHIAGKAGVPCLDLAGQLSVLETAALIHRLDAYVAIDTGPAHMAAALGTPTVVLLGPAIVQQTKPLSERASARIIHHPVPCAPCYGTPLFKTCRDNICMKQIEVPEVQAAILDVLAKVKTH